MNFSEFKGYSTDFDNIDDEIRSNLSGIIFANRATDLTVVVGTCDKTTFNKICKNISLPDEVFLYPSVKWAVDLESLNSDKIRLYCSLHRSSDVRLYGYYINSDGKILEKKIYKVGLPGELLIHRYDSADNLISIEHEKECTETEWTGPTSLLDHVKNSKDYECNFMKKVEKNQTYLVIHNKNY